MTMNLDETQKMVAGFTRNGAEKMLFLEDNLIRALRENNLVKAKKVLNELLSDLFRTVGDDLEHFIHRCGELITLMSRSVISENVESVFVFGYEARKKLDTIEDFDGLLHWMNYVLKCFFSHLGDRQERSFWLDSAIEYIRTQAHRPVTLSEVAGHVYLSPDYFSKRFHSHTGRTFSRYVKEERIRKSMEYLKTSRFSLAEVAHMFCFSDQSHYTRTFKAVTGQTPSQYRNGTDGAVQPSFAY